MTIAAISLIDLSGEEKEENKSGGMPQIDIKRTLSEAINRYKSKQPLNGTCSNRNSSNRNGDTNHKIDSSPGKIWYEKLPAVQQL